MPADFVVDDMTTGDLELIEWSGSATHIKSVAGYLERRDASDGVEYLVVRDEDGVPVSKACIEYTESPGAGTVIQVCTRGELEGRGLATMLLVEAERRIAARGVRTARLSVEPTNDRARRLYEHLGYVAVGERETGWEQAPGEWYSTRVIDMEKPLA